MHAVCLQQVLDAGSPSVQRWTLVMPASNACRWLTAILKCRFRFVRRFLHFIASLACSSPNTCCPPLCFEFAPRLASFSVLCPVFCIFHRFSLFCMVSHAPLHRFPLSTSFSAPCSFFCIFASFSAPVLLYYLHVARIAWFSRRFVLSLASAYRAMMLTA